MSELPFRLVESWSDGRRPNSERSSISLTDKDRTAIRDALRQRVEQARHSPETARARLVAEGFYTEEGELTPQYGGPKRTRRNSIAGKTA